MSAVSRSERATVIELPAGEKLDQAIRQRAWLLVLEGEIAVRREERAESGSAGFSAELGVAERNEILAHSDSRLLLFPVPWQGLANPWPVIDEDGYLDA